jgi:hypothetical protein
MIQVVRVLPMHPPLVSAELKIILYCSKKPANEYSAGFIEQLVGLSHWPEAKYYPFDMSGKSPISGK